MTASPRRACRTVSSVIAPAAMIAAMVAAAIPALAAEAPKTIRFKPGSHSATMSGAVIRGDRDLYTLRAKAGQSMTVRVTAVEKNAAFSIYQPRAVVRLTPDGWKVRGQALPGAGETDDAERWSGTLPATGTYLFVVGPTRGNATYRLTVTVR